MTAHESHDSTPREDQLVSQAFDSADDAFVAMLRLRGDAEAPAGELARDIDARLAADASLRAEAEALWSLDAMLRGLASRAADNISPSANDRALRASLLLMREQSLVRRQPSGVKRHYSIVGIPRWAWGTAVAAALAVGFVVWTANTDPVTKLGTNVDPHSVDQMPEHSFAPFGETGTGNVEEIQKQVDALGYLSQMGDAN